MSHLEELIIEYYGWLGYVVRHNQKVGRREKGGWAMELDVVAYDTSQGRVIHLEPSLDADNWAKREQRFAKKFEAGRKYIPTEVLPWVQKDIPIQQLAVLVSAGDKRRTLAGADVITVDELIAHIRAKVRSCGLASRAAIPEQYPMLRTIQLVSSGYYGVLDECSEETNKLLGTS